RHFVRQGHALTLFLPDLGERPPLEGFQVVYVPVLSRRSGITFFSFYFFLFFYFLFHYVRVRPHAVYTRHQQMEGCVTWLKYVLGFVYVNEVNGLSTVELRINRKPGWVIGATRCLERITFRMADLLVTPSEKIRDALCRDYGIDPSRFLVVSNGADPELLQPLNPEQCRRELNLDPHLKYLVFVGSFKRWHGISKIVDVFPQILERRPDCRLLLVGDGEDKPAIESIIRDKSLEGTVLLFGRRPFSEVSRFINAGDICIAPYFDALLNETGISPLKIYEYFACGKPVITSPMGGLESVFERFEVGVLVDSSDPMAWVDAVTGLLNDPERIQILGQNARRTLVEEFSWEKICQTIARRVEQVAGI
ncbi:MAG: hypothetical protein COV67_11750, partial [Nitrospinae bacterium CG11_big_fil_rev_8_21_14_0_20_56_8]